MSGQLASVTIRFGAFEVFPSSGQLRKHGVLVKLPEQSFIILVALLESHEFRVSREELRKRLWGDNTNVDFDHGLNAAVNRLREALGDTPVEPKFIETVPRRGYRFIAPIEKVCPPIPLPAPAMESARLNWAFSAMPVLLLAAAGGWFLWHRSNVTVPAPTVHVLTSYPNSESQPCFSPDGKQVAFLWGGPKNDNLDLYVKFVDAEGALRLTTDPALDVGPAWSPSGEQLAFLRGKLGSANPMTGSDDAAVYLVSPLGGSERKLANVPGAGLFPLSWSPNGKWLAFARPSGKSAGVYLLPIEGGEPRQITHTSAPLVDSSPLFSPDGRGLAYSRCTSDWVCDLYVQELDSAQVPRGGPRRITQQQTYFRGVTWVGDSLVYSGSLSVGLLHYLWRVNASGSGVPERLEIAGVHATFPTFSPAANRLAFVRSNRNRDIWRYKTGGEHELLLSSSLDEDSPQFSPNGEKIAFVSSRSARAYDIWVANADGSNPVQLTNQIGRFQGSARWSPDGRWIAFDSQPPDGRQAIYVIDATGGRPRKLDLGPYQGALPSWSRDGAWIYFLSDRTGRHEIWRVHAAGGHPEQITTDGGHNAMESVDGKTLFYAKENLGTPLFARSLAGGPERKVVDLIGPPRDFPVFEDGIYYGGRFDQKGRVPLLFYQFSTGASRLITTIEPTAQNGLTVSPDRKTILYTRTLLAGSDLMMIENFH